MLQPWRRPDRGWSQWQWGAAYVQPPQPQAGRLAWMEALSRENRRPCHVHGHRAYAPKLTLTSVLENGMWACCGYWEGYMVVRAAWMAEAWWVVRGCTVGLGFMGGPGGGE